MDELALKHFKDAEVVAVADHHPVLVVLLNFDVILYLLGTAQPYTGGIMAVRQKAVAAILRLVTL
jgi:hypothetical protein